MPSLLKAQMLLSAGPRALLLSLPQTRAAEGHSGPIQCHVPASARSTGRCAQTGDIPPNSRNVASLIHRPEHLA